jgi:hypothetical protein
MKRKPDLIERLNEFNKLADAETVEARIAWLEWKMVAVLWLLISVTSTLCSGVVAWIAGDIVGSRSLWLEVPVFLFTLALTVWWLQRHTFRGSPPHIDFIDP